MAYALRAAPTGSQAYSLALVSEAKIGSLLVDFDGVDYRFAGIFVVIILFR